jgi:predicted nucleic acid-binding protein
MKIVVDTSVIIAVLFNEPIKPIVLELTTDTILHAPASLHWEIGNALSAMFKQKRISLQQAEKAYKAYKQIPLKLEDIDILKAIQVCHSQSIYAYDSYFIVCAQKLHAPLLTLDKSLSVAASQSGIKLLEVK